MSLFDQTYYLATNPDVASARIDAFDHYASHGWLEGRNPSPHFDTQYYLQENPDVRAAAINPLFHYVRHGKQEGRLPLPPATALSLPYSLHRPELGTTGSIDVADGTEFHGWVADTSAPSTRLSVEVLLDGTVAGTFVADSFRQDLRDAGIGDGFHAFAWRVPENLRNDLPRRWALRVKGHQIPIGILIPSAAPAHIQGYLDGVVDGFVVGWARNLDAPAARVQVTIRIDDQVVGSVLANRYRSDLSQAGIGDGQHGFELRLPDAFRDGKDHALKADVLDQTLERSSVLPNSKGFPAELDASAPTQVRPARRTHSVVVCVYNALDDVKLCLDSLLANRADLHEVVVIDDCSDRPTREFLTGLAAQQPMVKYVRANERGGYTKSANLGLSTATGDIMTLLNSDTVVSTTWSRKTLAVLAAHPEVGVLGPLSSAASHQSVPETKGQGTQTAINSLPFGISVDAMDAYCAQATEQLGLELPYVPLVHGFCMTISRECYALVGGFDDHAFPRGYGEENDFCIRATDAGCILAVATNIYVYHSKSKSYTTTERSALMQAGWDALVAKHGKRRLGRAVETMENQPTLRAIREAVRAHFYAPAVRAIDPPRAHTTDLTAISFFLPQFHPIPFNDEHWGEGFTEWYNVVRARPRFDGHPQPKLPGRLGFYDLRLPATLWQQAELARQFGVHGMCFYYYRLNGKRLLDAPSSILLRDRAIDMRFCYCWANENWTRAWDGNTSQILLEQRYDASTFWGIVDDVAEAVGDQRYIRIASRPVFLIYQASEIPDGSAWIERLRVALHERTGEHFLIGTVYSSNFRAHMLSYVDFVVQFPPHRIPRNRRRVTIATEQIRPYDPIRSDYFEQYDEVIQSSLDCAQSYGPMYLGVCPDWDNSSRRESNAHILVGSTPQKFEQWVKSAAAITRQKHELGRIAAPVLFVNAWNEWAEGAMLEPTREHGTQYLEALRSGLAP